MATSSEITTESVDLPANEPSTLCEAFQATAARCRDAVALRTPGAEVAFSWREYAERVSQLAAGLAAHGIGRGDVVAMMLANRPEAHLIDTAALHLGAPGAPAAQAGARASTSRLTTRSGAASADCAAA